MLLCLKLVLETVKLHREITGKFIMFLFRSAPTEPMKRGRKAVFEEEEEEEEKMEEQTAKRLDYLIFCKNTTENGKSFILTSEVPLVLVEEEKRMRNQRRKMERKLYL